MTPSPMLVGFAEIPTLVGRTFVGEPFALSGSDQKLFESATWIDRAYPDEDPPEFPPDIIEGFFSLALLDALSTYVLRFDPASTYGFNYGLDRVRFPAQLKLHDRLVPRFEVRTVREKGLGLLVMRHCTVTVDGSDRPGVVADWWTYFLPRGTASAP